MTHNQRLILAVLLSTLILFGWQLFIAKPAAEKQQAVQWQEEKAELVTPKVTQLLDKETVLSEGHRNKSRISLSSDTLQGSVNLVGARLDDITLKHYKEDAAPESNIKVTLFAPSNTREVYFAEFGWINLGENEIELPNSKTRWTSDQEALEVGKPLKMHWQNSADIVFTIEVKLDEEYMINVVQSIENGSESDLLVRPYFLLNKSIPSNQASNMLLHEGAIGVLNNKLNEVTFGDIKDDKEIVYKNQQGWLGFADKYWLTAVIPARTAVFDAKLSSFVVNSLDRFQADGTGELQQVSKNGKVSSELNLFVGPKKLDLLEKYQAEYQIPLFDRAVDFGILYFITKPIFMLLSYFYQLLGNFGYAILLLTVFIKLLLFPLSYKSFVSMNKLKELQPQMLQIKEKYAGNMAGMQKAILDLYKREKANPMSGCLPILIQMPIFFALYKVLYVTIEMRHAPFISWIQDLSAPDPTSIFNLFGLLPWQPPALMMVGVLPILMALTMYIQQRLNPEPSDPVQAKVMRLLPVIFLFMFSSFPSGLVLYWAWSNLLSIIQQLLIRKMHK